MSESPRWSLRNPHYLNVPVLPDGTRIEWEHKETDRNSGRAVRKLYPVPALLDPKDPSDCNYPGEIIVCHGEPTREHARDITFIGDPTPDMEALNEAAEAISAAMRPRWEHPIDTLPVNGGMNGQEQAFMQSMMTAFAKEVGASLPAGNQSVPKAEYDELKARLDRFEAMLAAQPKPESTKSERRV